MAGPARNPGPPGVLPLSSDMIFTAAAGAAEQELTRGSELRVLETLRGHIGLFGMNPHHRQQVDAAPGQLLARPALPLIIGTRITCLIPRITTWWCSAA